MKFSITTRNINSVRLRTELVSRLLTGWGPDNLYLQEIKCEYADFPIEVFRDHGHDRLAINGQAGYRGVAIVP